MGLPETHFISFNNETWSAEHFAAGQKCSECVGGVNMSEATHGAKWCLVSFLFRQTPSELSP